MTDQGPIDPSTLRDGDIVRAKRGEHGVVEGVFCRTERGGWCLHDGPKSARETAWSAGGWTITDILRPVLVKGDRVRSGETGLEATVFDGSDGCLWVLYPDGSLSRLIASENWTRLPAAPEPAPIEVGDWWADMPTQADVLAWVADRWPNRTTPIWRAGKLAEEAGEVMGAVIKVDEGRKTVEDIRMEAAQVVICAMGLAESVGFDLWQAVADEWKRSGPATLQIVHTLEVE